MCIKRGKKGQVTIFIIIGIVLVILAVLFFIFRNQIFPSSAISKNIEPVYNDFLSCVEEQTLTGISVIESKGGRIYEPNFEPGSSYMPFSNLLNFLGNPIPYWYYITGNNIEKEYVPTKSNMQEDLAKFIEDKISKCSFDKYYPQGFTIYEGEPKAKVTIQDDKVLVDLSMPLSIESNNESAVINSHQISVDSNLGNLYHAAIKVYNYEQDNLFLEDYTLDVLRLYAPVDGVLLTCSPKTWNVNTVIETLKIAISSNLYSVRNKDGDYSLTKEENKYFIRDFDVPYNVRFLTSPNWSSTYEVTQATGNLLLATPIGNQAGLGIIGFCYVPYHFVYDMKYPVLVQVSYGDEIFQFPFAVVISGNTARHALNTSSFNGDYANELCNYPNTPMTVKTYNNNLDPMSADISFECVGSSCSLGTTDIVSGLTAEFPQCGNGIIRAKAEGYIDGTKVVSTIDSGSAELILKKLYEVDLNLKLNGAEYNGDAIVLFSSDDYATTISYPSTRKIELGEGQYEVRVYIYRNSSLKISSTTTHQCVDTPKSGLSGLFGLTEEKCFDIQVPEQIVSNALAGGGVQNYYLLDSEIAGAKELVIDSDALPVPATLEQLQNNYILFEDNSMDIIFK